MNNETDRTYPPHLWDGAVALHGAEARPERWWMDTSHGQGSRERNPRKGLATPLDTRSLARCVADRDACVRNGHGETQKQCDRAATSTRFAELRDWPRAT